MTSAWPSWASEPVRVVGPDPGWAERGVQACGALERLIAPWLVGEVEHVGSTAVPGLAAKPILDLQAPVTTLDVANAVAARLGPHGWHAVPAELDGRPYRRFFVHVVDGHRAAHLHLMLPSGEHWRRQLAFRDALRASRDLAAAYAHLKVELAERYRDEREAYTAAKADFVGSVLDSVSRPSRPWSG